jgi:hypothetical protein
MIRGALLDLGNTLDKMGLQCSFYFRGIKSHFSNGPAPRSSHPWLRKLTCLQSQSVHWAKIKWQDVKATVAVDGDLNIIVDMIQSKVDHSPEVGSSSKTTLESPSKAIATCTMLIFLHSCIVGQWYKAVYIPATFLIPGWDGESETHLQAPFHAARKGPSRGVPLVTQLHQLHTYDRCIFCQALADVLARVTHVDLPKQSEEGCSRRVGWYLDSFICSFVRRRREWATGNALDCTVDDEMLFHGEAPKQHVRLGAIAQVSPGCLWVMHDAAPHDLNVTTGGNSQASHHRYCTALPCGNSQQLASPRLAPLSTYSREMIRAC